MTGSIERAAAAFGATIIKGPSAVTLEEATRKALATIHEPSDAMITAGANALYGPHSWVYAAMVWRAMHDEMMREGANDQI